VRSISHEDKARCFKLVHAFAWSNSLRLVLMYYAIEIDSSLFLLGCPRCGSALSFFWDVLDVDLPSLSIVGEPAHRV
jgi:hypothetical protein